MAAATALACLAAVPAALAHGGGDDYRSEVTGIAPAGLPVEAEVEGGDDELRIVNRGEKQLVVYGYQEGPRGQEHWEGNEYVRITPDGVHVNHSATAYYLNQDRYGTEVPADADTGTADFRLQQRQVPSHAFHDHRIHWMNPEQPPPGIDTGDPAEQKVYDWKVPIRYGDTTGYVTGTLTYVGGKRSVLGTGLGYEQLLTVLALLAMVPVFFLSWRSNRRSRTAAAAPGVDGGAAPDSGVDVDAVAGAGAPDVDPESGNDDERAAVRPS